MGNRRKLRTSPPAEVPSAPPVFGIVPRGYVVRSLADVHTPGAARRNDPEWFARQAPPRAWRCVECFLSDCTPDTPTPGCENCACEFCARALRLT